MAATGISHRGSTNRSPISRCPLTQHHPIPRRIEPRQFLAPTPATDKRRVDNAIGLGEAFVLGARRDGNPLRLAVDQWLHGGLADAATETAERPAERIGGIGLCSRGGAGE